VDTCKGCNDTKRCNVLDACVKTPVETVAPVSKPSNPKDAIGSNKLPLHLWPETATATGCLAFMEGALKYGRSNFREIGVRASIYIDALHRHANAWFEGEDCDPDSGLPHLSHALACLAIIVDAQAAGKLHDDRQVRGGYRPLVDKLTAHVTRLKQLHADKSPKHYTIADNK
jgi:hypothetical protein